ncbi:zinc finger SWIM domain-containing protein 8 isoform X2 [Nilaparvata lugens]|uniref:zinc finger SWIM domain-containing protein 8 isoform X2 n=1 Tax=Nilaparvata lugens TaxID=108931 RepID=UPI00193E1930|nr:zinc finger SWIM domain-containing protein 8 isoform X2 [Nilaparvata lugens]
MVVLWRLAALNPGITPHERRTLQQQFNDWNAKIINKIKTRSVTTTSSSSSSHNAANQASRQSFPGLEVFAGFKPAIEACALDWEDYQIPEVTYSDGASWLYYTQPFTCFRQGNDANKEQHTTNPVNASPAVLNFEHHRHIGHHNYHHHPHLHHSSSAKRTAFHFPILLRPQDRRYSRGYSSDAGLNMPSLRMPTSHNGNRSSVSSEGFCENDENPVQEETDSQEGGGSDLSSSSGERVCLDDSSSVFASASALNCPPNKGSGGGTSSTPQPHTSSSSSAVAASSASSSPSFVCNDAPPPQSTQPQPQPAHDNRSHMKDSKIMPWLSQAESDAGPSRVVGVVEGGVSRRLSKDDSLSSSNSDSQQSGDEYNVYFFDPKTMGPSNGTGRGQSSDSNAKQDTWNETELALENMKGSTDPYEILFARAEGLHAHGHSKEACTLGVELAENLLANPPDLMIELPPILSKGKRKKQLNPASHQLSVLASDTLAKCAFLCTVLAENPEYYHLAFRVGLFGLEMARPPASTKPLEVKLANQESELVNLLKRIPLDEWELSIIRERAQQLKDGTLRSRGEALLPINLAGFLLDALITSSNNRAYAPNGHQLSDESLGFEAAVAALGLKANISEADHPLLCEGTRRQRGDLALTLLVLYKDNPCKLARIMEKLLDRDVHQLVKSPVPISYYSSNPPVKSQHGCRPPPLRKDTHPHPHAHARPHPHHMDNTQPPLMCPSSPPQPPYVATLVLDPTLVLSGSNGSGAGSRPHSCNSAELEVGLAGLPPPPTPTTSTPVTSSRSKESCAIGRRGKRACPSIPNQPSEAGAHFTFELAKTVLMKAGGSSSTSLFTQVSSSQAHHGPHRALHMCAFQLGLYALGLHNCVSPNWLSRTYSSHVSWITGQAMEIGAPAISFLMDTWEGHLTPPEAASIADRASRGCDDNMVYAAAELALSCLPHAHALNPNEIQRAILQCKEQSDLMLEQSCLTVENAAKGGGVYPEVLFQVAKYWYELFVGHTPGGEQMMELEQAPDDGSAAAAAAVQGLALVDTSMPPLPPPPPPPAPFGMPFAVAAPYGYAIHPHPPTFQLAAAPTHHIQIPTYHLPPPPTFQYPPHASNQQQCINYFNVRPINNHQMLAPMASTLQTTTTIHVTPNQGQLVLTQASGSQAIAQQAVVATGVVAGPQVSRLQPPPPQQVPVHRHNLTSVQLRYLLAAYRVGMLALDTLARRVHDDRPQAKYARNPLYGEDVKWLLRVSKKLGTQYLVQFCLCAVNSIVSPFVLHDVALEAAHYLARNNPALVVQHLRSNLAPLVQKCQQMYIQCMHLKLYHLSAPDYEDFVSIVCSARAAFQITPEGNAQFKEWLQSIRRQFSRPRHKILSKFLFVIKELDESL